VSKEPDEIRPDKAVMEEPAAWIHTMWMELGQWTSEVTFSPKSPFGVPGRDHSECYPVTSEPLFRKAIIKKPKVKV
jgi:hypothetical protein